MIHPAAPKVPAGREPPPIGRNRKVSARPVGAGLGVGWDRPPGVGEGEEAREGLAADLEGRLAGESHSEMAGFRSDVLETIESPDVIFKGGSGELLATRMVQIDKYLVVVYKEVSNEDGFLITAFLNRKQNQLERRSKIWERQK